MIRVRGDSAVKERPKKAAVQKKRTATPSPQGSGPPAKPPAQVAAVGEPGGMDIIVRGLPADMGKRLEAERARRGLRSRNDVAVAVLNKGVPK